jgi:hypothetical protein
VTRKKTQVLVALSSNEVVYFELDAAAGVLLELERLDAGAAGIEALAISPTPDQVSFLFEKKKNSFC